MTGLFIVNVLLDDAQCHDLESLDLTVEEGVFAVTVYSNRYAKYDKELFEPALYEWALENICFQQDGASQYCLIINEHFHANLSWAINF